MVEEVVPLSTMPAGSKGIIEQLSGGVGLTRRLMEMGMTAGTQVEVIRNDMGPIVVKTRGITIAIGRGMANHILVRKIM
ncbi:MAG: ferrous iron transport protein A [Nitrososphaeria archaeon]|nr:ferrous iron transport protein A [Nitrososphaeria archaeon]